MSVQSYNFLVLQSAKTYLQLYVTWLQAVSSTGSIKEIKIIFREKRRSRIKLPQKRGQWARSSLQSHSIQLDGLPAGYRNWEHGLAVDGLLHNSGLQSPTGHESWQQIVSKGCVDIAPLSLWPLGPPPFALPLLFLLLPQPLLVLLGPWTPLLPPLTIASASLTWSCKSHYQFCHQPH